jgi:hypothetical protein
MATAMCLNSRLNERHRDKPEGVPLLSDLPARSVFADTVPAFPRRTSRRCVLHCDPALGAGETFAVACQGAGALSHRDSVSPGWST